MNAIYKLAAVVLPALAGASLVVLPCAAILLAPPQAAQAQALDLCQCVCPPAGWKLVRDVPPVAQFALPDSMVEFATTAFPVTVGEEVPVRGHAAEALEALERAESVLRGPKE